MRVLVGVAEIFYRGRQVGDELFLAGGGEHRFEPFILPGCAGGVACLQKPCRELLAFFGRELPRLLQHTF
jgi:hypothetical protein